MTRTILSALISLIMAITCHGQRVNSIAKKLKLSENTTRSADNEPFDTIKAYDGSIRFSGYEKTLRATKETVLVSNVIEDRDISAIIFTVTYNDKSGRLLHKRRLTVHQDIPAGETRKIDFPTWDRQMTFYYCGSPRPRVSAIPYNVTIEPDTILLSRKP